MRLLGLVAVGLLFQGCVGMVEAIAQFDAETNRYYRQGSTYDQRREDLQHCTVYGRAEHPAPGKTAVQECMEAKGYTRG